MDLGLEPLSSSRVVMGTNMWTIRTLVLLGNMTCARRRRSCMLDDQSGFGVMVKFGLAVEQWSPFQSRASCPSSRVRCRTSSRL